MSAATLLVELFTEELPPKALKRLGGMRHFRTWDFRQVVQGHCNMFRI